MFVSLLLPQQSWKHTVKNWILYLWITQAPFPIILWLAQAVWLGRDLQIKRAPGSVWAERRDFFSTESRKKNYTCYKSSGTTEYFNSSSKWRNKVPDQKTIEIDFYLWAQKLGLGNEFFSLPWSQFLLPCHSSGCSPSFSSNISSHRKVSALYGNQERMCNTSCCARFLPTRSYKRI